MKNDEKNTVALACLVAVLLGYVPCSMMNAWFLALWWKWFAVPLGLPTITLWHVWGLAAVGSHLTKSGDFNLAIVKRRVDELAGRSGLKTKESVEAVLYMFTYPLGMAVTTGVLWCVRTVGGLA